MALALKAYGQLKRGEEFEGYLPAVIGNLEKIRDDSGKLNGRKIGNYEDASSGDESKVVVDRHVARMLFGVVSPTKAQFEKAEKILPEIADLIGWEPRQVQAAIWAASIRKSGNEPESYDAYLERLKRDGSLERRIGFPLPGDGGDPSRGADGGSDSGSGNVYRDRAGVDAGEPLTETEVREGIEDESGTVFDGEISDEKFSNGESSTTFSVVTSVPTITRESLRGKSKFVYFSDWTRVGVYTGLNPESGISIELQGGPLYPYISLPIHRRTRGSTGRVGIHHSRDVHAIPEASG